MKTKYIMPILVAVLALSPLACPNPESSGDGGVPAKTGVLTYLDRYSNATNIDGACSVAVSPRRQSCLCHCMDCRCGGLVQTRLTQASPIVGIQL